MCKTMKELEAMVAEYRNLKAMQDELEAELKQARNEIISYLDNNNKVSETGKDFNVKVQTCTKRTLDAKRLEADLGSLADYQRVTQYRTLYVN